MDATIIILLSDQKFRVFDACYTLKPDTLSGPVYKLRWSPFRLQVQFIR